MTDVIGRDNNFSVFDGVLEGSTPQRVLFIWGVPGIGKSRLLEEFRARAMDQGWSGGGVDLATIEASNSGISIADAITQNLLRLLTGHLGRPEQRTLRQRFEQLMRPASEDLSKSRPPVEIRQSATLGGHIDHVSIDLHDSRVSEFAALLRYRSQLVDGLLSTIEGVNLSRVLLCLDTYEVIQRVSPSSDDSAANLARWLLCDLIGTIVTSLPTPPVVAIGSSEPAEGLDETAVIPIKLEEWSGQESIAYAVQSGLSEEVGVMLAEVCGGLPLWSVFVAQECLAANEGGSIDTEWLTRVAAQGPAETWIPREFLNRLPERDQELVLAAAVLQEMSFEAIEAVSGTLSHSDWTRLCSYTFVETATDLNGNVERRMHRSVASSITAYLKRERPVLLRELHRKAAEYFYDLGRDVNEHYHRFAGGDYSHVDDWVETIENLLEQFEFEKVETYLSAADPMPTSTSSAGDNPRLRGITFEYRARLAAIRDQLDRAIDLATLAVDSYHAGDEFKDESDALFLLATLKFRTGAADEGVHFATQSRRAAKQARDGRREGRALAELAAQSHDSETEGRFRRQALDAFRSDGDAHREATMLRKLGDLADTAEDRRSLYEQAAMIFSDEEACVIGKGESEEAAAHLAAHEGDLQGSIVHLKKAEVLFSRSDANDDRGRVLSQMAHVALTQEDFDRAKELFEEAILAFESVKNVAQVAATYQCLAEATADWLGMSRAFDGLQTAFDRFQGIDDIHGMASVMEALGKLQARERAWPNERGALEQALTGYRACRDVRAQIRVLLRLARSVGIFFAIAEINLTEVSLTRRLEAFDFAQRAYDLARGEEIETRRETASLLGEASMWLSRFDLAREKFGEALIGLTPLSASWQIGYLYRQIAAADFMDGNAAEAAKHCREAILVVDDAKDGKLLSYLYQDLGDYVAASGSDSEAAQYYAIARDYFDSSY